MPVSEAVAPPRRRAAVVFILITLGIDALGIGLVVPIVPELVRHLSGFDAGGAAYVLGPLVATFALAQLFAAPILGSLSDRFGRRPVMLLSLAGLGLNYVLLAFAWSLPFLFLGRAIAGATSANFSTASAYIADVSTPEERARRFGWVGATFSLGFVVGPAVGGLLGAIDLRLPFLAAAGLSAANVAYGFLVLPESLPLERRQPFLWKAANPFGSARLLLSDRVLRHLAVAWVGLLFGLNTLQTVFVLANGVRFGWGTRQNGFALALLGVSSVAVQTLLVRRAVARLGEAGAAVAGFILNAAAYVLMALATAGWQVMAAVLVQALGGIANPAVRAMASNAAGPERQGRVMGALSVVEGATAIVSPILIAALFGAAVSATTWHLPGAPFLVAATLYVVSAAAVWTAAVKVGA